MRRILPPVAVLLLFGCSGSDPLPDAGTPGAAPPPQISAVSPTEGPISGGTFVLVSGANFQPGAILRFGGVAALEVSMVSATRLSAKTPPRASPGTVAVEVENPDGQKATVEQGFVYAGAQGPLITEARLLGEAVVRDLSGADPVQFYVRAEVEVPGITAGAGQGSGVLAQVGFVADTGSVSLEGLQWTDAQYQADAGARDVYRGQVSVPGVQGGQARVYAVAARFSVNGGTSWTIADLDGASNGTSPAQLQRLEAGEAVAERCRLQYPPTLQTLEGVLGANVYGWVWVQGVTEGAGQGAGISGEAGYGPVGSHPSSPSWTWVAASFNEDKDDGAADEYRANFTGPAPGQYQYGYRFRVGGGPNRYCDLDGSEVGGFTSDQAGALTALELGPLCRLVEVVQPGTTQPVASVASGDPLVARAALLIPGVTDQPGPAPGVVAQVGVGSRMTDASLAAEWGWRAAAFERDDSTSGEDVWKADFDPAYSGDRAVSFRFSLDGGSSWAYCDLDGSANGYSPAEQHALTVLGHQDLDYCALQHPPTATNGTTIYGRVYEAGLTPGGAAALEAALGFGPEAEDPGVAWTWLPASFNTAVGNDDEFKADLSGLPAGSWRYAFRFRKVGAPGWCYGDFDGNGANPGLSGFNGHNASGSPNLGQANVAP